MSKIIEYGEFDVSEDRGQYIGGSDIPAIMGISPFKRRYDLLLEKAGLQENTFRGNAYTEYGHIMEPKIRAHINTAYGYQFKPNRVIDGDIRCHTDGFDDGKKSVLEIKTTSDIHATVDGYKLYLVQLVKYMDENDVVNGILAVYERPEDFTENTVFEPKRLQIFHVNLINFIPLLNKVDEEINRFRADLARLKENPLLSEQDFLPANESLVATAEKVVALEKQLSMLKEVEQQCKEAKRALYFEMAKHGVKSWATPNGTKITMVEEVPASVKMVTELDIELLKREFASAYTACLREVPKQTNGKSGYVRITVPKG